MKLSVVGTCLLTVTAVIVLSGSLLAAKLSRVLEKVHYQQYAGPQMDWPRSTEPMALVKTRYGMPIYEKLPSRPYQVLGTVSAEGDHAIKHAAEAAQLLEADGVLVVGDKAFTDAGLKASPQLLENVEMPDPHGPTEVSRLEHPEVLKDGTQPSTIRVTRIIGILIRWTTK
ncbi:MAG TPA: hypothetical protein VL486_16340 [Verrucomicrobiae bacterium]|nr:hypothetical protein [Verrucomicrobiae bacterium]